MPRKKTKTRKTVNRKDSNLSNPFARIKLEDSYVSLIVGVLAVLVVVIGFVFFLKTSKKTQTSSIQYKPTVELPKEELSKNEKDTSLSKTYIVKSGETLWEIAEKTYKSGYNWVDIAKANKLENPGLIHAGNKLVIPSVQPMEVSITQTQVSKPELSQASTPKSITGGSYKVEKGDYLWEIAIRAYGDGFAWVKIAKANNLSNPNLIFSGNVLTIPR
ncbi:LysM peptidoglycan-binding domain-containing protein [Patescibacteria group bacterium]|nr:LysM peptidoglycan-binding domain-containing protein [Patescibacteria group bacterium]